MAAEPLSPPVRPTRAQILAWAVRHPGNPATRIVRFLLDELDRLTPREDSCPLTPRELDVLIGAARGESNEQTADRLHLHERWVANCRSSAYRRIGAVNGIQAVAIAMARGWITPDQIRTPGDS